METPALEASLRRTLKHWLDDPRFLTGRESPALTDEIWAWLGQIERECLPTSPGLALELSEALILADGILYERWDDGDNELGDALSEACAQWLKAAAALPPPAGGWRSRVQILVGDDDYGARRPLLDGLATLEASQIACGSDSGSPAAGAPRTEPATLGRPQP